MRPHISATYVLCGFKLGVVAPEHDAESAPQSQIFLGESGRTSASSVSKNSYPNPNWRKKSGKITASLRKNLIALPPRFIIAKDQLAM
jgi:hypothetical protein